MRRILLINGPNLNLLGRREPGWYGDVTLSVIEERLKSEATRRAASLESFQSNAEHELVDRVQALATAPVDYAIINPGAFTHTSIALHDAILASGVPTIEVHISNVAAREEFRHHSMIAPVCVGSIVGLGWIGYQLALEAFIARHAQK